MKIYTLTGDDGTTSLSGGKRVPKHSPRVEAYGTMDELISWIGLLRNLDENRGRRDIILYIQDQLMRCATILSCEKTEDCKWLIVPDENCLKKIETEIDTMENRLPALNSFILPGGSIAVSYCHITRCVCRRAERTITRLNQSEETPEIIIKILNRLSDFLFVMARLTAYESDIQDIKWPMR